MEKVLHQLDQEKSLRAVEGRPRQFEFHYLFFEGGLKNVTDNKKLNTGVGPLNSVKVDSTII
jgi:hypothetical protein